MNLLNIEHISKIYGEKIIFDDASFGVQEGDKIGIVGINGTGKTTLLRMIAGTEVPDDGQIIRQNGMKIAHLTQNPVFPEGATILSYVQSVAEDMEWRVQSNLNTLGITDHTMKIEHLSGGQKRRVAMAKVLAEDFDLLLLDEPTNHLDGEMISWLEGHTVERSLWSHMTATFWIRLQTGFWRSAMERCTAMMPIIQRSSN